MSEIPVPKQVNCPRCRQLSPWTGNPYRPFCSERCRLIDLGAWANEDYALPAHPALPSEQDDTLDER